MPVDNSLKAIMAVGCLILVPIMILVTLESYNIGPLVTDADREYFATKESNTTMSNITISNTTVSNPAMLDPAMLDPAMSDPAMSDLAMSDLAMLNSRILNITAI